MENAAKRRPRLTQHALVVVEAPWAVGIMPCSWQGLKTDVGVAARLSTRDSLPKACGRALRPPWASWPETSGLATYATLAVKRRGPGSTSWWRRSQDLALKQKCVRRNGSRSPLPCGNHRHYSDLSHQARSPKPHDAWPACWACTSSCRRTYPSGRGRWRFRHADGSSAERLGEIMSSLGKRPSR